ncbi:MAG: tetratricopeptide repeat protein [Caulobacter sp.]
MIQALVLAVGLLTSSAAGAGGPVESPAFLDAKAKLFAGDPEGKAALEALAREGDPDARILIGGAMFVGRMGYSPDKAGACRLFDQAAPSRPYAAHLQAECVEQGHDEVAPDPARARILYRAAADRGFAKSKCALGNLMIAGKGGAVDVPGGMALCREAADAGDGDAQTDLGDLYLRGQKVPRDMVQARAWYEKAAAAGHKNACFTLGQIYWNGDGVAKDNARAARLWRTAYDKGRLDAAALLGDEAFVRAAGAKPKFDKAAMDEAIVWYEKALAQDPAAQARIGPRLDILRKIKAAGS